MRGKTGTILDYRGTAEAAMAEEPFHPGWRGSEHELGVSYTAPWEDPYGGFPEHARRCARALDEAGLPVHLRSLDPSMQIHMHFEVGGSDKLDLVKRYEDLLHRSISQYAVEIFQIVPDDALLQRLVTHRHLDPKHLRIVNRYRVLSTVWERNHLGRDTVRCLNAVGQCWVANEHDVAMLAESGVDEAKIRVVPVPYFPGDPHLALARRKRLAGVPRFYHIGKWEPRKAQHEMVGAYLCAFYPEQTKLYFKTSTTAPDFGDYPRTPEESIRRWLEDPRVQANGWSYESVNQSIHLIKRHISPGQMVDLHRMGDVYLSLSRGEGFDMPAFDSKLSGNLLVYTPSGGPQSFAAHNDERVSASGTVPCHPWYRWSGSHYLDWSIDEAVAALREACRKVEAHDPQEGPLGYTDLRGFRATLVGKRMRAYIEDLCAT